MTTLTRPTRPTRRIRPPVKAGHNNRSSTTSLEADDEIQQWSGNNVSDSDYWTNRSSTPEAPVPNRVRLQSRGSRSRQEIIMEKQREGDSPYQVLMMLIEPKKDSTVTAVITTDLRLDMHPSSKDPGQATGIIQANSGATNKQVREFIKGKSGGHKGTHQVIEKIRFPLGPDLNIEALANAVEHRSDYANASGSETATTVPQSGWTWSEENQQIWLQKGDGSCEWRRLYVPDGDLMHQWQYSAECQRYYRYKQDGKFEWAT